MKNKRLHVGEITGSFTKFHILMLLDFPFLTPMNSNNVYKSVIKMCDDTSLKTFIFLPSNIPTRSGFYL